MKEEEALRDACAVKRGDPVTRDSLRLADLTGFDHDLGVTHIGICIGDGRMVHAP